MYDSQLFAATELLREVQSRVGKTPRWIFPWGLKRAVYKPPTWLQTNDGYVHYYANLPQIVKQGVLRWGVIVQANAQAFEPGFHDCAALAIYSVNGGTALSELYRIAESLFAIKGTRPKDSAERKLAEMITDEYVRAFDWPVPTTLTKGLKIFVTAIVLPRVGMPGGILSSRHFPVFADPASKMASLVPGCYWPKTLYDDWIRNAAEIVERKERERVVLRSDRMVFDKNGEVRHGFPLAKLTSAAAAAVKASIKGQKLRNYCVMLEANLDEHGHKAPSINYHEIPSLGIDKYQYQSQGIPIAIPVEDIAQLAGMTIDHDGESFSWRFPD